VVRARAQLDPNDLLPCSPTVWELPEFHAPLQSDTTSALAMWVSLNTKCLVYVHLFFQTSYDLTSPSDRMRWQNDADAVNTRLVSWRHEFAEDTFRLIGQAKALVKGSNTDPDFFLVRCTFDA